MLVKIHKSALVLNISNVQQLADSACSHIKENDKIDTYIVLK